MTDNNDSMDKKILEMIQSLGGIEQFQSNPFTMIGEFFKHPELLSQIDQMSKTPEMQERIAESMTNPMFQQIVANNPALGNLMKDYKNKKANISNLNDDVDDDDGDVDDELGDDNDNDDEAFDTILAQAQSGYDIKLPDFRKIDWLNSAGMQSFYVPEKPEDRKKFEDIIAGYSPAVQEKLEILAERRLREHLNSAQLSRLDGIAESNGLTALDLMATVGGFMGEFAYCATIIMPDENLTALAKHALACLHQRSGFPVASYISQLVLYLDSFDDISRKDWENFAWSMSGCPSHGRDGNFVLSWPDVLLLGEIAAAQIAEDTELYLGVILGLLSFPQLDLKGVVQPLQSILRVAAVDQSAIVSKLKEGLSGRKFYAISLLRMRQDVRNDAVHYVLSLDGLEPLLQLAADWPITSAATAMILVDKLDLHWSKVSAKAREAFLAHALEMDSEALAAAALRVGVAWQPDKYRFIALDSSYPKIKAWAEGLK